MYKGKLQLREFLKIDQNWQFDCYEIEFLKIRKNYTVYNFITLRLEILPNSIQSVIVKRLVLCENPVNKSALYFVCMWPFKCNTSWHCFTITLSMYANTMYTVKQYIARYLLETRENIKIDIHPFYSILFKWP